MAQASAAVRQQRDLIEEALERGAWQVGVKSLLTVMKTMKSHHIYTLHIYMLIVCIYVMS